MCKFTNCERDILTTQTPTLMPRYLHIPHTPDTARTLVINIPAPNIIRGRSTFVCFVPEFLHQIQYIPSPSFLSKGFLDVAKLRYCYP